MAGIFNSAIFNNQVFNTGQTVPVVDTHDGGHYKRYRKRLERLAKLADEHNQSKYVQIAEKTIEIADELQISLPEVFEAPLQSAKIPEFDFSALQAQITRMKKYLDDLIAIREIEEEEETIIMMSIL